MPIYNIPENFEELMSNGEENYSIIDESKSGDNIFAIQLFIESVGIPSEMIEDNSGTQITIFDGEKRLVVDACGLGDFSSHAFQVSEY